MIAYLARHPTAANLLMAAIMILGAVSLPTQTRETFPDLASDTVRITVVYPGAATAEVEDAVCRRVEDALEAVTDLDELTCEAAEGRAVASAVLVEGADMTRFFDDVKAAVDAIDDFPAPVEVPRVEETGLTDAVVSVAVTGPDDPVALKAYAEDLKSRLGAIDGIARVSIAGFSDHQVRIEVPATRLRQYGLSAGSIAEAVARNSVRTPAGRLEGGAEDLLLRIDQRGTSAAALRDLVVVSGTRGASIRLGEIATVTDRFDRPEEKILFNGRRAAMLDVEKTRDQDILAVLGRVSDFVDAERMRVPPGVSLALTRDRASIVADRLNMLVKNGLQGLLLVFAVLWLFFPARFSFWVVAGLPVSFLGALFLLPTLGISLNMISLVALLIGIGLLMDDAIVIAENVAARRARGDGPMTAAIEGTREVLPGIASSFATTVLVFGSLAFISGNLGQVLRVLPVVLIVVLAVSLVEAFCILPNHLGHALAHDRGRRWPMRERVDAGFARLRDGVFAPLLRAAVAWRYLTAGLAAAMLLAAIALPLGGHLKFVGFPSVDGDILEARLALPQGTPLARTEALVEQLLAALARAEEGVGEQPGGEALVRNVTVIFARNPDAGDQGPHLARVVADLLGAETRSTTIDELRNAWREETGQPTDVLALTFTEPAIGPAGRAIDIRLAGDDLEQLKEASLALRDWLGRYRGVVDLDDDLRPGKREYRIALKDAAGSLGIDARLVAEQLRAAFQGITVDEFNRGSERYEVDLRLTGSDRDGPEDLASMFILSPSGAAVPLSAVATIEAERGWARIARVDGRRTVTVHGDVDRAVVNAQELVALAEARVLPELLGQYPGLTYEIGGESSESATTGASIVRNVLLGLLGVYMLLALQFRGYLAPLSVMLVIPTAFVGVAFGHWLLGLDLTMPSIVGMASLFGVVVNDSILLVVFIRAARRRGMAVTRAAVEAGLDRFRPILLTSVSTIAGLAPLLAETSLQAQVLIPLAASLAFGLATATTSALLLVPAFYAILDDFNALGQLDPAEDAVPAAGEGAT